MIPDHSNKPLSSSSELLFESDWLASQPIFYNTETSVASKSINDVIRESQILTFHPEGLYNYLDFGYSVFEQTPISEIRFLPHSSRIWRTKTGELKIEHLEDPFFNYDNWKLSEFDVIELIKERVQKWESSLQSNQEIVLPLSGGFDSRLLLCCLKEPSRVRAYTYGTSPNQAESFEVIHARALAKKFDLRWEQIPLGDFHQQQYFEIWNQEFGISTHAHGMYHIEFYTKIRERLSGKQAFLSGIVGDLWAGGIPPRQICSAEQLTLLGYTHGLRADPTKLLFDIGHELRNSFWAKNKEHLKDYRYQVVTTIRLKLMLLSYLIRIPRLFGFEPWTPFLDIDVAMAMLNLPQKRRQNRQWQRDFFSKIGLDIEYQTLKKSRFNTLDIQALKKVTLQPLDKQLFQRFIEPGYVDWINNNGTTATSMSYAHQWMSQIPKVGGLLKKLRLQPRTLEAYNAWLCLKPFEYLLIDRLPTK